MSPILEEIYSTIIPSAPYIICAYALLWLVLLVYLVIIARGTKNAEKQMQIIEEQLRDMEE